MKTRPIELYCIRENRTWDTVIVDIPAITHPDKIEEVARKVAAETHGAGYSFMLYNSMDDDMPELEDVWIITVQDNARAEQKFVVEGAKDDEEALDMMGDGNRESYGDDEVISWLGCDDEYKVEKWR